MPTFSIIVPIYNAEKTLRRCLDSLRNQAFQDFEVLLIENGSTDASGAVCREYAAKDPRFVLYAFGNNRGPSGARNAGLDRAAGSYIAFLDSDDYVEPEYLQVLSQAFEKADAVFFGYHQVSADGCLIADHIPDVTGNIDYYETLLQLSNQDMFGYTWIKAFRRELIGDRRFSVALNLLEDEVFACEVLSKPCRIAIVPRPILNYVTGNPGSLIGRTHQDYCRKVDAAYCAWRTLLGPYEGKDKVLEQMANANVCRCMYYGFERDVDVKAFFKDLTDSTFVADATQEIVFVRAVRSCNYGKIFRMRAVYRLRNTVATLLKR